MDPSLAYMTQELVFLSELETLMPPDLLPCEVTVHMTVCVPYTDYPRSSSNDDRHTTCPGPRPCTSMYV